MADDNDKKTVTAGVSPKLLDELINHEVKEAVSAAFGLISKSIENDALTKAVVRQQIDSFTKGLVDGFDKADGSLDGRIQRATLEAKLATIEESEILQHQDGGKKSIDDAREAFAKLPKIIGSGSLVEAIAKPLHTVAEKVFDVVDIDGNGVIGKTETVNALARFGQGGTAAPARK